MVACELAQFLSRVGSKFTILQRSVRLMMNFPPEASKALEAQFKAEGINVITGVRLEQFSEIPSNRVQIKCTIGNEVEKVSTGFLFLALGRIPNLNSKNMGVLGVETTDFGHVKTNEFQLVVYLKIKIFKNY